MKTMKKILTVCALCAGAAVLATSCSKKIEGNEKSHPTYIKAKADAAAGKYKDAADGLNDLLARAPRSALLHMELAKLYGDHIADYYSAIYHYQQYIKLAKLNDDDKRNYRAYQNSCKRQAALQILEEDPTLAEGLVKPAAPDGAMVNRLSMLEQHNAALLRRARGTDEKIKALEAQLAAAKTAAPVARSSASAASAGTSAPAAAAPAAASGARTYMVQPGDNLGKITRQMYGSNTASYRKIIMDANGMTSPDRLSAGKELKIPALPNM